MRSYGLSKKLDVRSTGPALKFHLQLMVAGLIIVAGIQGLAAQGSGSEGTSVRALGTLSQLEGGAAGSALNRSSGLVAVPEDFATLKIGPGFLLNVQVYGETDLGTQLRVSASGDIVLPLVGKIHVAGETLSEITEQIQDRYKSAKILLDPQVTLDIAQYAPMIVPVLGEVGSPGRLQLLAPHSLLDVISLAGGETALAGNDIEVRHDANGQSSITTYHYGKNSNGSSISGVMIGDGDTVIVPRAGIVYVLGAVYRPGGYLMQEDGTLDVAQALSLAMGTTLQAKTSLVRVIRRQPNGGYVEFTLSYAKMTGGKITPPLLQAQDIVYVPVSKPKAILTGGTQILSAAASATIYTFR